MELPELDITTPGFFLRPDYFEILAQLRADAPLYECQPGTWTIARHADIRAVGRDPERFCSSRGALINDPLRAGGSLGRGSILHLDPPDHAEYRRLVNRDFTPKAVAQLEPYIRAVVRDVFDSVPVGEEIDFVGAIAAPIPVVVIAELLGVGDGDRDDFRRWSDATIESTDHPSEEQRQAGAELFGFLDAHIEARELQPADDVLTLLTRLEVGGERLRREEVLTMCLTLLVAGNETTRHLISGGAQALFEHPTQRARLADEPGEMSEAVEECLRWVTPIQAFGRTTTEDVDLAGRRVPAGDFVVLLYASGNRDEDVFGPSAGRFDATRPINPTHVAFGFGEHLCLGASLARLETRIVFEELLARFPNYEITGDATYTPSTLVRGPKTLPAVLAR
jgi:cytochrome P450